MEGDSVSTYTLHLGDCLEVMPRIPDASIDAIIADWPYGVTQNSWDSVIPLEPLWGECERVVKRKGVIVLTARQPFTSILVMSNPKWFKWDDVWDKKLPTGFLNAKVMPLRRHESVLVFGKGRVTYNPQMTKGKMKNKRGYSHSSCYGTYGIQANWNDDYYPTSVIEISNANQSAKLHETEKPVALMEYLVKTYTNPGDLVLDNTFGSCSTGEACLKTGRRFIGIEKDPEYFRIGQERLERVERELREAQLAKERQPYLMNSEVVS
jgi:site-specific DNA-methyltransferase (adenine-specific)